ncbi:hypothetical protein K435DRAFT_792310 [Dendrothele bispora CBS 962.96]|uniref:Peptidase C14 caspase domain-containing protein n=1 Tax=Dendrothele bispora (strain CBS 962.96) TaxID=1314807 RepID=A0A4S8MIZ7_DENBC|nr:hypothetical protein K435DRAFT_792310 [Dendrothele bispora CBS 962.96]
MFLPWLKVNTSSVNELLWYIQAYPPPQMYHVVSHYSCTFTNILVPNTIQSPPKVTTIQRPPSSLFALIIGINQYQDPDISDLQGAVADADAMEEFLISDVRVPTERIINLRNKEATREAMIRALEDIANNSAIGPEDPILIFYAGHGGELKAPQGWETPDNMIQMLLPYDFVRQGSEDISGQGIFDRTLLRILEKIAQNKSDNISVIFDSCHSGSGTRDPRDETFAIRGIELPKTYKIPLKVLQSDSESGTRASAVAKGYEKSGLRSHVLLAACMRGETAKEWGRRGVFTTQLLELLKEEGVDRLTYKDVITRLHLKNQSPQCEGDNQTRILFNSKVTRPSCTLFNIEADASASNPYIFKLEAGEAHGITNKSQFAVYSDMKMTTLLGTVTALNTTAFETRCTSEGGAFTFQGTAYAIQTHAGEKQDMCLRFINTNDSALLNLFVCLGQEMQRADANKRTFRLVDTPNDSDTRAPDLAISTQNGFVQFHIEEKTCQANGLTMMPYNDVRVDDINLLISILRSAADFYWNLNLKGCFLGSKVTVDCLKVVDSGKYTDDGDPIFTPQEVDGKEVKLNVEERIIIDVDEDVNYGYRINNTSNKPLYAALFYFDVSDLSVESYYLPGTAARGNADISIPPNGSLSIGYGDSGTSPYTYFLRNNQNVDVGFLKLFLSTQHVDYSGIFQTSPFDYKHRASQQKIKKRDFWDTIKIPMIQQKGYGGVSFGAGFNAGFCF